MHENLFLVCVRCKFFDLHAPFGFDCDGVRPREVCNFCVDVQWHPVYNVKKISIDRDIFHDKNRSFSSISLYLFRSLETRGAWGAAAPPNFC